MCEMYSLFTTGLNKLKCLSQASLSDTYLRVQLGTLLDKKYYACLLRTNTQLTLSYSQRRRKKYKNLVK
jgi:hypothetical protein